MPKYNVTIERSAVHMVTFEVTADDADQAEAYVAGALDDHNDNIGAIQSAKGWPVTSDTLSSDNESSWEIMDVENSDAP